MIETDKVLDAKGLSCPMPIVRTKMVVEELTPGQVVEVLATDKGSTVDIEAWAERAGHQYLGTVEEDDDVLKHYVRKVSAEEEKEEISHQVINNTDLQKKLDANENIKVIDVREQAEYAINHIPEAISIPIGELNNRLEELNKEDELYVVCRTGNRSDMAAKQLSEKGFNVTNVIPGMSEWDHKKIKNKGDINNG